MFVLEENIHFNVYNAIESIYIYRKYIIIRIYIVLTFDDDDTKYLRRINCLKPF